MGKKIFHYFKMRPGLFILIVVLFAITVSNLKPDYFLLGWDNYSSYFNLKTNIFRTFFATWREYRGLGVPSDSESTDIFRQIFYLFHSPFVKTQLLDQIYILFAFNAGTIFMYFFAGSVFQSITHKNHRSLDLIGLISSLFYIFNLNTLATFYFPMIMFVNRFYTFPLLLFLLSRIIEKKQGSSFLDYLLFIAASILTSGTYMTATVFVTFIMSIFLYLLFAGKSLKGSLYLFILFIGLNSFWLLPFTNYTIQRSGIVYSAPTFIEANEIQLNKPASFYSWEKQLILYPNFFDTPIDNMQRTMKAGYHPIIMQLNNPATKLFMLLFPFLFIIGSIAILLRPKKNKHLLWIPSILFLYVFLSFKAFSPLGFIYIFLESKLPFFTNLFRFGDTKFHFFIAFAGSLAVGYLVSVLLHKISQTAIAILSIVILICGVFTFRDYISGNLLGFFMKNNVPNAYFQLAAKLNTDKSSGRVLHLPYDQNGYWRSYSWGYLGSSFLHFMIDRPLIEKTFEPGSQENARLNTLIFDGIANAQLIGNLGSYQKRTTDFYQLLKKTGIIYIVMDETVSSQQPVKGISLWGRFNEVDSRSMIAHLEEMGYVKKVSAFPVHISDYADSYDKIFPLPQEELLNLQTQLPQEIILYEVIGSDPQIRMTGSYRFVDSASDRFNTDLYFDTLQKNDIAGETFPFARLDTSYSFSGGKAQLALNNISVEKGNSFFLSLPAGEQDQEEQGLITIYAKLEKDNLLFTIYSKPTPNIVINGNEDENIVELKKISVPIKLISLPLKTSNKLEKYLSNWQALPYKNISSVRIQIGDTILPVPPITSTSNQYVGSLVSPIGIQSFSILIPQNTYALQGTSLRFTDSPNCFGDKLSSYSFNQTNTLTGSSSIFSQNGSTCFLSHLSPLDSQKSQYSEIHFSYQAKQSDLDSYDSIQTSKPIALKDITTLPKPNILSVCMKDSATPTCYNTHQVINLANSGELIIPTEKSFSAFDPVIFFVLKNTGSQSQIITIPSMNLTPYKAISQSLFSLPSQVGKTYEAKSPQNGKLSLGIELPMNTSSFYQAPQDGFYMSNGLCAANGAYRTFRQVDGKLMSYFVGCDSNFSLPLDYKSDTLTVWSVDYNLASGKFPRFSLSDGFIAYVSDYLSLHQGYPALPSFLTLQNPENLFSNSQLSSRASLQALPLSHASVTIVPHPEYQDVSLKNFQIAQDSENEGVALYKNMRIMTLPNIWHDLGIDSSKNGRVMNEVTPEPTFQNILPSLWKVNLAPTGKGMLVFNEAYDEQWGIYESWGDMLLGKQLSATHYKCNGFAICFDLQTNQSSFYIFYLPEKLNLFGWIATFLLALFALFLAKKPLNVVK